MQHLTFVRGLGVYGKSLKVELDGILEVPFSGGLLGSLKYVFCSIHEDKSLKKTVSARESSGRLKGNFLHPADPFKPTGNLGQEAQRETRNRQPGDGG
tara:strand:+ start:210 stop:503 length:294 start_codon:yes stop_codon:yes gene_type:complete